ncbi:MAG TPA: large-conductance mechanosensitive channel protein MscL [Verrucomicrobiae bacterium]|nr:large-conductance mechanosensitive channel protein MscL [Verrucomicrobiae bacterium]
MSFFQDFKKFISQGNVADLAIAVVIGAAFGKIVSSLVGDLILPPVGLLLQGVDLKAFKWVLQPAVGTQPEVAIAYGNFVQVCLEFLVLSFIVFLIVKFLHSIRPKEQPSSPAESAELKVLKEIRDSLKK